MIPDRPICYNRWRRDSGSCRTEIYTDKCLPPPNNTLVRELCGNMENYKEILTPGGYPTEFSMNGNTINVEHITAWCEACVNPVDWYADNFTPVDLGYDNIDAMGILDWPTLTFASYIVALTVIGEMKDIELCGIAIERLGDQAGAWRHAITVGNFLRRAAFLPLMLSTVSFLVGIRGGDSLIVCFNTVAILFMTEVQLLLSFHVLA